MSDSLFALLLVAAFLLACFGMWLDVCRVCERAQHDLDVDAVWGEDDPWEVSA